MSRKTITAILSVIGAILIFFNQEFGLGLNATAIVAGLTAAVLYIFFEAKLDFKRILGLINQQSDKWKDPKFWLAFLSAVLIAASESFGLNLPVEAIVSVLTVIMSVLFGVEFNKAKT